MKKSLFKKIFWSRFTIVLAIVVIIMLLIVLSKKGNVPKIDTTLAQKGRIYEEVSVTGKILANSKAELAFEKGGIINSINHKVGDSVKRGELIASLKSASDEASLANAKAQLAEIKRGLRKEEYAQDEATFLTASTSLANARESAITAIRDAYAKAQGAIVNYADTVFDNPQSVNPTIFIRVQSSVTGQSINLERLQISQILSDWNKDLGMGNNISTETLITRSESRLDSIKTFLYHLSAIVNDLNPGNSGISQSTISSYVNNVNSALTLFSQAESVTNTADTNLKTAKASFAQAENTFNLAKAGSSAEAIAAQTAKVAQAEAELNKNRIYSPISGTLTKSTPDIGQYVTGGENVFAVQSSDLFKIEANVPEADIAKISVGNKASVTLDAYGGSQIWKATVSQIDPAETVIEGVPTYKVTLFFDENDSRIRSGMTANTDILTHEKDNVITVPTRAVKDVDGKKVVQLVTDPKKNILKEIPVEIGLKGSNGMTEIISGINENDKVVTFIETKGK